MIKNSRDYDGKTVVYAGEAIGDIMRRGSYVWLNVNDGKNAIGVWAPAELSREIFLTGSYKTSGDIVEISGVFRRACPEHGGDLDIHALSLRKAADGRRHSEGLNPDKKNQAIILLGVLIAVWILSRFIHK